MSQNQIQTVVTAAALAQPANSYPVQAGGRQQDAYVSEIHGKYYAGAYGGNMFTTSVPAAGTLTIPTTLATLASKFCLVNPPGSGKNLELVRFDYFINSATEVVNVIGITKSTTAAAALATLTTGVINNTNLNSGLTSVAIFYTAATHTDTPVWYKSLIGVNATAVGLFQNSYMFDGTVVIPPGMMIDVVASAGAQANSLCDMMWLEWPI